MLVVHIRSIRRAAVIAVCAAALGALLLVLAGCLGKEGAGRTEEISAATDEERLAYLTGLGWQAEPEPVETLNLELPGDLTKEYGDYAALQEEQGFPFSAFGGRTVSRYTYRVTNYPDYDGPVQADLYVCDGLLIGGDVTAPGKDGFIRELAFPKQKRTGV